MTKYRAMWEGAVLAESDKTIEIEGNQYFPQDSVNLEYFKPNDKHTVCPWKGVANYYNVVVGDKVNEGAAWYYPKPKEGKAQELGFDNYVAFWKGVKVEAVEE